MAGTGKTLFQLGFEISPIILTNGIAASVPGKMLPIVTLTEAANIANELLTGSGSVSDLNKFFAHFTPLPGTSFIENEVATYPFANQTTAANSIIARPLRVSMMMVCPVKTTLGYFFKLATMQALQKTLALHNSQGGTYIVITPSYIYTGCLMTNMADVSGADTKQTQYQFRLDFLQPLLNTAQAQAAQSNLMTKLSGNTQITGLPSWSSVENAALSPFSTVLGQLKGLLGATGAAPS